MDENLIRKLIEEKNIKFLMLQFTDILGINKSVTIPTRELGKALNGEIMFDGSAIEGFVRVEESDMYLKADPKTFKILPWKKNKDFSMARFVCDIYKKDGIPFEGCPRYVLNKVILEAEELGYIPYCGPEAEFFLFLQNNEREGFASTHDQGGYFDLSPIDKGEEARNDMVLTLEEMGFEIESAHHENSPGQHEIDFKYSEFLTTADNVITFKHVVKVVAEKHNLNATFMPKPLFGVNGSGMHLHISLSKNGKNIFYDPEGDMALSNTARYFIGGLIKHVRGYTAITNPIVNSYKRLVPGFEAPVYIAWSERNRSPLIRIPGAREEGTRLELRLPDPSCNPYLAFAAILKAGLDGIKHKLEPPRAINSNMYNMTKRERIEKNIEDLPSNLYEAIMEFSKNKVIKSALGNHISKRLIEAKLIEWETYSTQIHTWELSQYLKVF